MQNVTAIVVTYNGSKWIDKCFNSLLKSSLTPTIYVIDNLSNDDTVHIIKEKYPEVKLLNNKENLGFGRANNLGIKLALEEETDFIFLLNQDAWVAPDAIEKMVNFSLDNKNYGIISAVHLNGKGDDLDAKFRSNFFINNKNILADFYFDKLKDHYNMNFVNAAAWLVPKKVIENVGCFDPYFFMYGEDTDFCNRILYHDYKICSITSTAIFHDRENRKRYILPFFKRLKINFFKIKNFCYENLKNINFSLIHNIKLIFRNLTLRIVKMFLILDFAAAIGILLALIYCVLFMLPNILKNRKTSKNKSAYLNVRIDKVDA